MDSSRFADENYTKFHVNRTIYNEASEKLYKWFFHLISFIMLRITSFLVLISSAKHRESIGTVFAEIWWDMWNLDFSTFNGIPNPSRVESHKIRCGITSRRLKTARAGPKWSHVPTTHRQSNIRINSDWRMSKILKDSTTIMIALLKCWQTDVQTFLGKYEITGQKQRMNSRWALSPLCSNTQWASISRVGKKVDMPFFSIKMPNHMKLLIKKKFFCLFLAKIPWKLIYYWISRSR